LQGRRRRGDVPRSAKTWAVGRPVSRNSGGYSASSAVQEVWIPQPKREEKRNPARKFQGGLPELGAPPLDPFSGPINWRGKTKTSTKACGGRVRKRN